MLVFFVGLNTQIKGQCINTIAYGTATIDSTAASPIVIDACNQAVHYAAVSVLSPGVYTFSSSVVSDYLTITDDNNVVIEHGPQPLSVLLQTSGNYRIHIAADSNCTTSSTCRETAVEYISPVPTFNFNAVAPPYDFSTFNMAGITANSSQVFYRNSFIVTQSEFQNANLQPGSLVQGLGFTIWKSFPASDTVEVAVKIYLENTIDSTYQKGTTWGNIIPSMDLVLSDTIELIISQGRNELNYTFDTVFSYAGNGVYVATDWEIVGQTPAGVIGVTYYTNSELPNSLVYGSSQLSAPTTLQPSGNRPETRWGVTPVADDFEVLHAFMLGTNMLQNGYPEQMEVRVRNNGFLPANKPVTITISGANTYAETQNVQLASGADTVLFFTGFSPVNVGLNTLTAFVPMDMIPDNNSVQCIQQTTMNRMGYIDTNLAGVMPGRIHQGGMYVNRHYVHGAKDISAVRVLLSNDTNSIGKAVYGVVLDSAENIVGQSDTLIISANDLGSFVTLNINSPPTFIDESFFVGMAQIVSGSQFYSPFSIKSERPKRSNAYFQRTFQNSNLLPSGSDASVVLEAVLESADCPAPTSLQADDYCDSIVVSWNSPSQSLGSTIEYGPTGFTPGNGTIITGAQSPHSIHGIPPGSYDMWLTDTCQNTNSQSTGPVAISIIAPHADYTFSHTSVGEVLFDASGSLNSSIFDWDFGDGNNGTGQTITHTYTTNGTYDVTLVTSDSCRNDTLVKSILIEGISTASFTMERIQIYPNPAQGVFYIDNLPDVNCSFVVSDVRGSVVLTGIANNDFSIDLSAMAEGVYFIAITSRYGRLSRKVILAR
ncbi:MAG: T9SS type A sorting domain-containing protein [Cryomorphaceae bacterium]|nr:T9SS type A sorting domain-containing protein [Cryomorphaceae bacterium]